ncbi:unnamed protein product, partial [Prorocentrum cordatum]
PFGRRLSGWLVSFLAARALHWHRASVRMLELPLDPWGLLSGGRCQGGQALAFATVCVTEEERGTEFLANCLASICALLATTDPECVVAIVSSWVYHAARHVLLRNGVLPLVAPTWLPHHVGHPFEHIHWKPHFSAKLEAFRLTGHDRVVWFDPDVLFMRNASGLLGVPGEFAASTSPKGKDPARYVNDGVMVFTPSIGLYNELITRWRDGSHSLHYSEDEVSDNDLVMEVCVLEGKCGAVSDLDACLYNHGVWLPLRYWRPCPSRAAVARHNFLATREPILTGVLHAAALRGTCRARAVPDPAAEGCWEGADEHGPFTAERCCRDAARGGDLQCWGHGKGFESCCRGARDAEHLQAELRAVGQSWYAWPLLAARQAPAWAPGRAVLAAVPPHAPHALQPGRGGLRHAGLQRARGGVAPVGGGVGSAEPSGSSAVGRDQVHQLRRSASRGPPHQIRGLSLPLRRLLRPAPGRLEGGGHLAGLLGGRPLARQAVGHGRLRATGMLLPSAGGL